MAYSNQILHGDQTYDKKIYIDLHEGLKFDKFIPAGCSRLYL